MKIYLFNPESGHYLGEDFADEALIGRGHTIPAGATTIAPPEGGQGHVLLFDAAAQCWEVHSQPGGDCKDLLKEQPDDSHSRA